MSDEVFGYVKARDGWDQHQHGKGTLPFPPYPSVSDLGMRRTFIVETGGVTVLFSSSS